MNLVCVPQLNTYVFTYMVEEEVVESCWSSNDERGAYISGWIKTTKNKMFNKIEYCVTDVEKFINKKLHSHPHLIVVTWHPYSKYILK